MKILVLGSEGQIGSGTCSYLERKGYDVIRWDIKLGKDQDLRYCKSLPDADKALFLAFDIGGSEFLSKNDRNQFFVENNMRLMINTFDLLKSKKMPFVFASSQMSNMLGSNYGMLKKFGEIQTRSLQDLGRICRFWNVYGKEDNKDDPSKNHVITDFIKMAESGSIKCKTTGLEERQFLHVLDCAAALETFIQDKWDNEAEVYDITSFTWTSIRNVARIISLYTHCYLSFGDKVDFQSQYPPNEPTNTILKYWTPKITLEEGIKLIL